MAGEADADTRGQRLILVDGHSLAHRAYFALYAAQRSFATAEGQPTGAVYGFLNMMLRMLDEYEPTHVAVVFDAPGPTFRHEQYAEYKAQRPEMATDLRPQLDSLHEVLVAMRVATFQLPGYEADDLLGTIACRAAAQGQEVLIFTGDRDALQLVSDRIKCLLTIKGVSDTREFDAAAVREEYGIEPALMRDVKALMGDSSDNVPGIKGIGEKTALKLVRELGSLDEIYSRLCQVSGAKTRQLLADGREQAFVSRDLVTIRCDAPLEFEPGDLLRREPDHPRFARLLGELEFRSFLKRLYSAGVPGATAPEEAAAANEAAGGIAGGAVTSRRQSRELEPGAEPGRRERTASSPPRYRLHLLETTAQLAQAVSWLARCEVVALDFQVTGQRPSLAALEGVCLAGRWTARGHGDDAGGEQANRAGGGRADGNENEDEYRAYHVALVGGGGAAAGDLFQVAPAQGLPEAEALAALAPLLSQAQPAKVLHDAKTPLVVLGRRGVAGCGIDDHGWAFLPGLAMDTAVAAYLLDPARSRYEPDRLAAEFLGWSGLEGPDGRTAPPAGGRESNANADKEETAERLAIAAAAGRRAVTLLELRDVLQIELAARGLSELWQRIELPLVTVLARMELTGVCLDMAALNQMDQVFSRRLQELTVEVHALAGTEFNLNSTRQLAEVLYERLGLPATKRTRKGKVASTDAETLEGLADRHPVVPLVLQHRQLQKLKGTYIDGLRALADPRDGRIRTVFHQTVATTGRLSSVEPNLQNIPIREELGRQIRRAFVSSGPGHLLLTADYSQIELRVLAHLSADPVLIEAFELDQDIHRRTAAEVFGVSLADVTPDMRQAAKAVNFGIIYGISDYGLARNLGVGRAEAGEYIKQYFARYERVAEFFAETIAAAKRDGFVQTILGRIRHLPDIYDQNFNIRAFGERTARNTPIQGSAADIIKLAMVALDAAIVERGWRARMVLQVHDELLFDTPEGELPDLRDLVVDRMQSAYRLRVPLKVDTGTGRNWYEAKNA